MPNPFQISDAQAIDAYQTALNRYHIKTFETQDALNDWREAEVFVNNAYALEVRKRRIIYMA